MSYRRDCWGAQPAPELDGLPPLMANKIAIDSATGCWRWLAAKDARGYGRVRIQMLLYKAHRVTFHILADPTLPLRGSHATPLDHVAERCALGPSCVNPAHLERVSNRENCARGRRSVRSETKSPYLGVVLAADGRWNGQIQIDRRTRYIGRGEQSDVAHLVDAAYMLLGDKPLNFTLGLVDRPPTNDELRATATRLGTSVRVSPDELERVFGPLPVGAA